MPKRPPSSLDAAAGCAREDLLTGVREAYAALPGYARFVEDWPRDGVRGAPCGERRGVGLSVLKYLGAAIETMRAHATGLAAALERAAPKLCWRQTYGPGEIGADFLDNYGWAELVGLRGILRSERLACGILLLGPHTSYPRHRHPAEELYLPLSGTAAWQRGDEPWREISPGSAVHHRGDEPHAMRTMAEPLLAAYVWCGAGIGRKSRLDADG